MGGGEVARAPGGRRAGGAGPHVAALRRKVRCPLSLSLLTRPLPPPRSLALSPPPPSLASPPGGAFKAAAALGWADAPRGCRCSAGGCAAGLRRAVGWS